MSARGRKSDRTTLTAQEERQGRIVLNTTSRRVLFFGSIFVVVALAVIVLAIATSSA